MQCVIKMGRTHTHNTRNTHVPFHTQICTYLYAHVRTVPMHVRGRGQPSGSHLCRLDSTRRNTMMDFDAWCRTWWTATGPEMSRVYTVLMSFAFCIFCHSSTCRSASFIIILHLYIILYLYRDHSGSINVGVWMSVSFMWLLQRVLGCECRAELFALSSRLEVT